MVDANEYRATGRKYRHSGDILLEWNMELYVNLGV